MSRSTVRNSIIALIMLVISAGVFGFMFYQVESEGEQLSKQIETLEVQQAQEASHLRLRRLAEQTQADRTKLRDYFFARDSESIDFLNQVESLAPQVGVTLQTSGLETINDEDGNEWIKVDFAFSGSRADVQRFIQLLENVQHVSRLTAVTMRRDSSTIWSATVTMQIRILNYDE